MTFEQHAYVIRQLAQCRAGETVDDDCPVSWETAAAEPWRMVGDVRDPLLRRFEQARRIIGDQVCGEIYRRELDRIAGRGLFDALFGPRSSP